MAEEGGVEYVEAEDGEAVQALFEKYCDDDGLMTKAAVKAVPSITDLLTIGDLLTEELDDIWKAAPKFPDVDDDQKERVDVDSFIQMYRDIDDIFEDDDDGDTSTPKPDKAPRKDTSAVPEDTENSGSGDASDDEDTRDEKELETVFQSLCDENGLVSRGAILEWSEIKDLLADEMLGEDEFDTLWEQTTKSPGSADQLDVEGFLSFNVALDDLFVFDDLEIDAEEEGSSALPGAEESKSSSTSKVMVTGDDLPPAVIFSQLADDDFLVSIQDLKRWAQLQEMLDDGDILPIELQNIYDDVEKVSGTNKKINEDGFIALYDAVESLFEDNEMDSGDESAEEKEEAEANSAKANLMSLLSVISSDDERLPCGLECSEKEQEQVLNTVNVLESQKFNIMKANEGNIQASDVAGNWELLYSSSSAMKFNKGLSGLGGSLPNGRFGGLIQKLELSKFMSDVEYLERIIVKPGSNSFDVRVTGDWKVGSNFNMFTGEPTTTLSVEPLQVTYGPTSTRADHWKSLGPLNKLNIVYLDSDLRIMKGTTSTETVFIFKRC